ncbi:MAG: hypothetical protein A2046_13900 [Bacteroidetes bacterium GWA2_30_7]|nr:MAG: hypothetical protein A2046_13900 [Bacteroidetes bacterium GWA2_30_7]
MKSLLYIIFLITINLIYFTSNAQVADSLNLLLDDTVLIEQPLLPSKMLITKRLLWGKHGFMRFTGIMPLNAENRVKEMKIRRLMLISHQALGAATFLSMVGTGITGQMLYNEKIKKSTHEAFADATNIGYGIVAFEALFSPPPLISKRNKKWSNIDWHKMFAVIHFTGMITTNILSEKAEGGKPWKQAHRASAIVTGVAFTAAIISIKF